MDRIKLEPDEVVISATSESAGRVLVFTSAGRVMVLEIDARNSRAIVRAVEIAPA